jgi:hypothetical protein
VLYLTSHRRRTARKARRDVAKVGPRGRGNGARTNAGRLFLDINKNVVLNYEYGNDRKFAPFS